MKYPDNLNQKYYHYLDNLPIEIREAWLEGYEEGFKIGKMITRFKVAARMLAKGYSFEEVKEISELSAEEIKSLKERQ